MLRWPGKVKPRESAQLATSLDILPTLLTAAGSKTPPGLPGLNLLDDKALSTRKALFGACFTHDAVELRNPAANLLSRWIIAGDWKLIVPVAGRDGDEGPKQIELYQLTNDPEERRNLVTPLRKD
jgi:arylsulfatase A-like enzyme